MAKYFIDFGTGVGNYSIEGTLEDAMNSAHDDLCYTQCDVKINNMDVDPDECVARLPWYGVEATDEDFEEGRVTESFNNFGFYGEWVY